MRTTRPPARRPRSMSRSPATAVVEAAPTPRAPTGTMTTEARAVARRLERYSRPARWLHAAVYLTTLVLLGTGWWLLLGKEGEPSVLARLLGVADTDVHVRVGWVLIAIGVLVPLLRARAVGRFLAASVRFHRGDLGWLGRWPAAVFTGKFGD